MERIWTGKEEKAGKKTTKVFNGADEIGSIASLSARNAEKRPRKGETPWLSMTFP
jgi:hypothetical protein